MSREHPLRVYERSDEGTAGFHRQPGELVREGETYGELRCARCLTWDASFAPCWVFVESLLELWVQSVWDKGGCWDPRCTLQGL